MRLNLTMLSVADSHDPPGARPLEPDDPEPAQESERHDLRVPDDMHGERLDRVVSLLCPHLSRTAARRLVDQGQVLVEGEVRRASARLSTGDRLEIIEITQPPPSGIEPEALPLDIVYEDEHLVVVNKAVGMVVHPGAGRPRGTLVAALLARYAELPGMPERPGIVHRLDRNTSGLMVVARTPAAMQGLSAQIGAREVEREYRALVWGVPHPPAGVIEARIGRSRRDRRRMAPVTERGRSAVTHYRVLSSWDVASLVALELETGRTHQIRVHLTHLGHPVVGDPEYGGRQKGLLMLPVPARARGRALLATIDHQALHAWRLSFRHPIDDRRLDLTAPLPSDFVACCDLLEVAGGAGRRGHK